MQEVVKISGQKDHLLFDRERGYFETACYTFPLAGLAAFSTGKPWQLSPAALELGTVGLCGNKLCLDCSAAFFDLDLEFSFDAAGFLCGKAVLTAREDLEDFSFSLCFPIPGNARLTLPMSCYNGNPSAAADRIVPRFPASGNAALVFEESRYPVPGVNAEFEDKYLSLFLRPGEGCSLGAERSASGAACCLISSGCTAFNGKHDEAYEFKCRSVHHPKGYRTLKAGGRFAMEFILHAGKKACPGEGFRDLVQSGWQIFSPEPAAVLSLDEVISRKAGALSDRWLKNGYLAVLPGNLYNAPQYYMYGWTGQCFRLALCDIRCGVLFGDSSRISRGLKAVEFFVDNAESALPGLYHLRYFTDKKEWSPGEFSGVPVFSSRAMGETFSDLARILQFCCENNIPYPEKFEICVRKGLDFMLTHLLEEKIPPVSWDVAGNPVESRITSAGTSMLTGLFVMYELTGEKHFLDSGIALLERFWHIGGDRFDTPFSHATLDSGCEDKEAAVPFFTAAASAFRLTGDLRFKHWAEASGDWLLTWVYCWNVPLRKESICGYYGFKTCGWPAVSVENQHLDVFFPAWEMFSFGTATGNELFVKAGKVVFAAWSYGISAGKGDWLMPRRGMQAEQFFQTEWRFSLAERYDDFAPYFRNQLSKFGYSAQTIDEKNLCGGCNPWEIAWIISLVLDAALSFKENQSL
ncbi:MAG: hypothetical protein IKC65_02165 [Lentisphaeria bacterium]|nr:hypothetical protein [Lentisphaeria bacterium]